MGDVPRGTEHPAGRCTDLSCAPCHGSSPALTDEEVRILEIERRWPVWCAAKDEAIRNTLGRWADGWSPWRYQQRVQALIDKPAALEHDPQLVNRLRRLRERRRLERTQPRIAGR